MIHAQLSFYFKLNLTQISMVLLKQNLLQPTSLLTSNSVTVSRSSHGQIDSINFDVNSAFDQVSHNILHNLTISKPEESYSRYK
jgi:hypothetical protein